MALVNIIIQSLPPCHHENQFEYLFLFFIIKRLLKKKQFVHAIFFKVSSNFLHHSALILALKSSISSSTFFWRS